LAKLITDADMKLAEQEKMLAEHEQKK